MNAVAVGRTPTPPKPPCRVLPIRVQWDPLLQLTPSLLALIAKMAKPCSVKPGELLTFMTSAYPSDASVIDALFTAFSVNRSMSLMTIFSLHAPETLIVFGPENRGD